MKYLSLLLCLLSFSSFAQEALHGTVTSTQSTDDNPCQLIKSTLLANYSEYQEGPTFAIQLGDSVHNLKGTYRIRKAIQLTTDDGCDIEVKADTMFRFHSSNRAGTMKLPFDEGHFESDTLRNPNDPNHILTIETKKELALTYFATIPLQRDSVQWLIEDVKKQCEAQGLTVKATITGYYGPTYMADYIRTPELERGFERDYRMISISFQLLKERKYVSDTFTVIAVQQ